MGILQKFENRLEQMVSGVFAKAFRSAVQPVEIAAALQRGGVRRATVILEVNGMKHPLDPPGIVIGRGTEADLRINDPGVSRRHAEIRVFANDRTGTDVSVVDLGSTNGMLVNGHKVQQATLDDGGTIKIGNTTMTVRFVPSGDADPDHRGPAWGGADV